MIVRAKALFTCTRSSAKVLYALRLTVSSWHLDKSSSKDGDKAIAELARGWRQHLVNRWRPLRHQDMVTCSAKLSVFFATSSQQKLPKTRTTQSEKKAKTQRSALKQCVLPAEPHGVGESETRHLNQFILHAQTSGAIITDVSDGVNVANACTIVLRCRSCSTA